MASRVDGMGQPSVRGWVLGYRLDRMGRQQADALEVPRDGEADDRDELSLRIR